MHTQQVYNQQKVLLLQGYLPYSFYLCPVSYTHLRPDIEETMSRDIFLLRKASGMIKIAINSGNTIDFNLILDEMWTVAKQEMNFLIEAKNAEEFYKLNDCLLYTSRCV